MPPTPAYPNESKAKQKQEIQSTRSRNWIVFHGAVQIITSRKMRFECEHGVQRKKLATAEVGKNEVFQNETERTRGDLHETQKKANARP
jgi:hypothetical protein